LPLPFSLDFIGYITTTTSNPKSYILLCQLFFISHTPLVEMPTLFPGSPLDLGQLFRALGGSSHGLHDDSPKPLGL
jgi:hypothetical protein